MSISADYKTFSDLIKIPTHLRFGGFTLAELLIALTILGEIATFTIPKIIVSTQNGRNKAVAKEVAGMISGAFPQMQVAGKVTTATTPLDLVSYFNYISIVTDGRLVDGHPTVGSRTCNATTPCIQLHGGGLLWLQNNSFGGTGNNVIEFSFDPDGTYSGSTADGPGKAVQFALYYNGGLTTRGQLKAGTTNNSGATYSLDPTYDPSWFAW